MYLARAGALTPWAVVPILPPLMRLPPLALATLVACAALALAPGAQAGPQEGGPSDAVMQMLQDKGLIPAQAETKIGRAHV